jgi:hypothetical protein
MSRGNNFYRSCKYVPVAACPTVLHVVMMSLCTQYVIFFPKDQKYIGLFGEEDEKTKRR